jgi:hypothetical protein
VGRDSVVGTATRCGLDGPGIESRWGEIFRTRTDRPCDPPSLLQHGYRVIPGVKRPGRGVDHPPSSSARVKERVDLYLYSPSGPSWPVLGRTLPYLILLVCFWQNECEIVRRSDINKGVGRDLAHLTANGKRYQRKQQYPTIGNNQTHKNWKKFMTNYRQERASNTYKCSSLFFEWCNSP